MNANSRNHLFRNCCIRNDDHTLSPRGPRDGQIPEKTDDEVNKWLQTKAEGQDPTMAIALMRDLFG
jgi:hypothetical protein